MSEKKEPSASEAMFFFAIVKHTKNKAEIDWNGVAEEVGFKNAEVAKVRFGQVKRKLGINSNPESPLKATASSAGATTPKKVTKRPPTPRKKKVKQEKVDPCTDDEEASHAIKSETKVEEDLEVDMFPDLLAENQLHQEMSGRY